jgi:hypothetical protein
MNISADQMNRAIAKLAGAIVDMPGGLVSLPRVCELFGVEPEGLLSDLRAGRLTAKGKPSEDGSWDIGIDVSEVFRWSQECGHGISSAWVMSTFPRAPA